jgi:hypothetical protein
VPNRYRRKSLYKSSSPTNKVWYFKCPNCNKPTIYVTHLMYGECGGKWCKGRLYLPHYEITQAEYERAWGKE